jgi:hypothetical protein
MFGLSGSRSPQQDHIAIITEEDDHPKSSVRVRSPPWLDPAKRQDGQKSTPGPVVVHAGGSFKVGMPRQSTPSSALLHRADGYAWRPY